MPRFASVPVAALLLLGSCAEDPPPPVAAPPPIAPSVHKDEGHFAAVRPLTSEGDNDAPRWSPDGRQVVLVGREHGCASILRATVATPPVQSTVGRGDHPAFLPGDQGIVYASSGDCDRRRGARDDVDVDPAFDVMRARGDGSAPVRLTDSPTYDGEPAVCAATGAIVFTSMRDGDLDLYRMGADGTHVERITSLPGYDGGAVFDADCSHIAWHAWHPRGKDLEDYAAQLARHHLSPTSLELWVANADGTDAHQVTYLDAKSRAPAFYPREKRLLFTSTFGGENARDVDLWAIDLDGTNLERVSTAPGQDGAPAFSPDGNLLLFTSARGTALGRDERNVFVAGWVTGSRHVEERSADHLMGDCAWLADASREGRALGTKGLADAGAYVARSFESFGLAAAGDDGYRQAFDLTTKVTSAVTFEVAGAPVPPDGVRALGFSSSTVVEGPLVFVGSAADYGKIDARGRIVVVRASSALRQAAWAAREHGAVGFVASTDGLVPEAAPESSEGIVAVVVSGREMSQVLAGLVRGQHPQARLAVTLAPETTPAFNVVARWPAGSDRVPGVVVVGAHYDGPGGGSPGADDNASGTAALLQVGRDLGERKPVLHRDVVLVGFSGEEQGAAGAAAFVRHPPGGLAAKDIVAMIDLDMVGRLRDDTLQVFGEDTAGEWPDLLVGACDAAHVTCAPATGGGLGGEDQRPFFEAGIPALHLFSGVHGDYHRRSDTTGGLNATGMAQVARIAGHIARDAGDVGRLTFQRGASAPGEGESRGFGASLGTIPDPAGPSPGAKGMLLAGVRPDGPADKAGLRGGDLLVRLGRHVIGGIGDVKFVLTQTKAGAHVRAVVLREGKELSVDVTLDAPARR